jgi:hypothetical protein
MMCFRDWTFCSGPCATHECQRQITEAVTAAAERAGLPLAISDLRDVCLCYRDPGAARAPGAEEGR